MLIIFINNNNYYYCVVVVYCIIYFFVIALMFPSSFSCKVSKQKIDLHRSTEDQTTEQWVMSLPYI